MEITFEDFTSDGEEIEAGDGIEEATVVDDISGEEIEAGDGTDEIEVEV